MDEKPWYKSLTVWGISFLSVCGLLLPIFGKADYATFLAEEQAGIGEWLGLLGGLIGSLLAFIGRFKAVTRLTT
jgi:hypothetical protein